MIDNEVKKVVEKIDFEKLRGKSVLVTGASGLVGLYLVSCLRSIRQKLNIDITAWIGSEIEPIHKEFFDGVKIIKGDITDRNNLENTGIHDVIIHSAGYGQPGKFLENKTKTISINTTSTIGLLGMMKPGGSFLYLSTSELYNGLEQESVDENNIGTTNTDHPRSPYIEGKRCGEAICHSYGDNVKIARLCLAYGPGTKSNDQRVLNSLIQKSLQNEYINLIDKGDAVRTYCYITDVVEMLWMILLHGKERIYNVGGTSRLTILELANMIGTMTGKPVTTPDKPNALPGNPKTVNVSIERYINEFGKRDFVNIEVGLVNTIEWQKKIYL